MPSSEYALVADGPKRLEVQWKGLWKDVTLSFDGQELGVIENKKALKIGADFALPDGTSSGKDQPQRGDVREPAAARWSFAPLNGTGLPDLGSGPGCKGRGSGGIERLLALREPSGGRSLVLRAGPGGLGEALVGRNPRVEGARADWCVGTGEAGAAGDRDGRRGGHGGAREFPAIGGPEKMRRTLARPHAGQISSGRVTGDWPAGSEGSWSSSPEPPGRSCRATSSRTLALPGA